MKMKARTTIACALLAFTMTIFGIVIFRQLGGDTILGAIIGHIAAWCEMVAIFYFRKRPASERDE